MLNHENILSFTCLSNFQKFGKNRMLFIPDYIAVLVMTLVLYTVCSIILNSCTLILQCIPIKEYQPLVAFNSVYVCPFLPLAFFACFLRSYVVSRRTCVLRMSAVLLLHAYTYAGQSARFRPCSSLSSFISLR